MPLRLVVVGVERADALARGRPQTVSDRILHNAEEDVEVAGGERIGFHSGMADIVGIVNARHTVAPRAHPQSSAVVIAERIGRVDGVEGGVAQKGVRAATQPQEV